MYCKECGSYIKDGDKFCTSCGKPVASTLVFNKNFTNASVRVDKKHNKKLIIVVCIIVCVLLIISGGFVAYGAVTGQFFGGNFQNNEVTNEQISSGLNWDEAKTAYLKKLQTYKFPKECKFMFIDINGDNIQELYMRGPDYATGDMLWTFWDGNVTELRVPNSGLFYYEGDNYFMLQQMHSGSGNDKIMFIENGQYISCHYGEWTMSDSYAGTNDKYVLDGETMSKSTYDMKLKDLFNTDIAKIHDSRDSNWMTWEQLKNNLSS